jgi:hypothetical protein
VFTGEVYEADIAIHGGYIVGIGEGYTAREVIDLKGRFVAPGFIDAHVHIESSMVPPPEFARAVVPHGTTTVIIDPHEIANVLGLDGIRYMLNAAKYNPLSVFVMLPSCVPASPLETSGAALYWYDLQPMLSSPWVLGLAEMMNYPGVNPGAIPSCWISSGPSPTWSVTATRRSSPGGIWWPMRPQGSPPTMNAPRRRRPGRRPAGDVCLRPGVLSGPQSGGSPPGHHPGQQPSLLLLHGRPSPGGFCWTKATSTS